MFKQARKIANQKGFALIAVAAMLALVMGVSTLDMVATSHRQLRDADTYIAIRQSEHLAIATMSPIRHHIINTIDASLKTELRNHLTMFSSKSLGSCAGVGTYDPFSKLHTLPPLCDPLKIVDGLQAATGKSINFYNYIKPQNPAGSNVNYDWQERELKRESYNDYGYDFEVAYVGTQILQDARMPRQLRKDLYRYIIKANVNTQSYNNVYNNMTQYYDVTVNISTGGDTDAADCSRAVGFSGGRVRVEGYQKCEVKNGVEECSFVAAGTEEYNNNCPLDCSQALYDCYRQGCNDTILNGKRPVGDPSQASFVGDCVTSGSSTRPGFARNVHIYSITVTPVQFGTSQF